MFSKRGYDRRILLTPAILAGCLLLSGWTGSWEQIRRESAGVQSIQARFLQKKEMKLLARPLLSEGRFYFQAPASVRWEYTAPVRSVLLMHGGSLMRFMHSGGQWTEEAGGRLAAMEMILQEISAWLHGEFDRSPLFAATLVQQPVPRIILTPRESSVARMIRRIELTPSGQPGVLKSIRIVEDETTATHFEFRDVQVNQPIPESLFRAVP